MKSELIKDVQSVSNSKKRIFRYLDIIWPIHRRELSKFISMTALMFCILFNQNIIRALKDGIIITNIGTETISFLKFWGVMPASFLMATLYIVLVNRINGRKVFFCILGAFLIFFALFAFLIFPNKELIHMSPEYTDKLNMQYPHLKWFIAICGNWGFSLFYIIAELWPTTIFSLLFWQFVNNITTIDQSKRFYPLFGLFGQTAIYFAGSFLGILSSASLYLQEYFDLDYSVDIISVQMTLSLVIFCGILSLIIFARLSIKVPSQNLTFQSRSTQKLSVIDSLKLLFHAKYIRLITLLLFCYGASINLVELPWKSMAEEIYPNTADYLVFVGSYLKYTGIFVICFTIIGSNIVRYVGWFAAAIATPLMVCITGVSFFVIANFDIVSTTMLSYFVLSDPIMLALAAGAIQNILSKSTKYTLFDATKEMVYVPLDREIKTKGKAAADLIGTKFGKSLSAFLQSMIFSLFPTLTYASLSSALMVIFLLLLIIWILCIRELGMEYNKLLTK